MAEIDETYEDGDERDGGDEHRRNRLDRPRDNSNPEDPEFVETGRR
ncbi:hypothetical protein [Halorussus caseinilyticus]|uniref:Uncharacterized protein n=2 Tax=Halorussus caseinilyticus TaxID=3034025 RepID=A0ABD5WMU9_9EURY